MGDTYNSLPCADSNLTRLGCSFPHRFHGRRRRGARLGACHGRRRDRGGSRQRAAGAAARQPGSHPPGARRCPSWHSLTLPPREAGGRLRSVLDGLLGVPPAGRTRQAAFRPRARCQGWVPLPGVAVCNRVALRGAVQTLEEAKRWCASCETGPATRRRAHPGFCHRRAAGRANQRVCDANGVLTLPKFPSLAAAANGAHRHCGRQRRANSGGAGRSAAGPASAGARRARVGASPRTWRSSTWQAATGRVPARSSRPGGSPCATPRAGAPRPLGCCGAGTGPADRAQCLGLKERRT